MKNNLSKLETVKQSSKPQIEQKEKYLKVIEKNYHNNLNTDFTDKIEELDRQFKYDSNSSHFWSPPELSLLYGTPVWEVATASQKLALNHMFWVAQYNYAAFSEIETIDYNTITGECFSAISQEYEVIARQLEHESFQERSHIHAFYKVNYQTIKALLGKQAFINPTKKKVNQSNNQIKEQFSNYQYNILYSITNILRNKKELYHSEHLKKLERENKLNSTSTGGFFHISGKRPKSLLRFFAFSWGSSPFLASQYYTVRFIANMLLKTQEHSIFTYFKKLQKQGEFLPAPTALSYYHFLDEAFHTTTSLFLARDLYKSFPKPTAYEKFIINMAVYTIQRSNLNQVSGVIRNRFYGDNHSLMAEIYHLFRSSLFGMTSKEALHWMELCFCHEHEGFHQSAMSYQRLRAESRHLCQHLDYLWPMNREMRLMSLGNPINTAIQTNIKTFRRYQDYLKIPA